MLDVIGAGFPRTGTSSLRVALERLGFAPCGHMTTLFHDPARAQPWLDAWARRQREEPIDWPAVIQGDRASVDAPACLFWRELTAAYPEARVILSVRDPQRWYDSVRETIFYSSGPGADPARLETMPRAVRAGIDAMAQVAREMFWDGSFGGQFLDRDRAIPVFEAHNAAVRSALPPERLLVWEAHEGWEPLCAFLGVPVPAEPFPHANDRAQFRERLTALRGDATRPDDWRGRPLPHSIDPVIQ